MDKVSAIAGIIAAPFFMVVIAILFGWRYRQVVEASMRKSISDARAPTELAIAGGSAQNASPPPAPLKLRRIEARPIQPGDGAMSAAFREVRGRRRPLVTAIIVAGTVHFGVSALALLWSNRPDLALRIALTYLFAAPEIGLVLLLIGAPRRLWAAVVFVYFAIGAILALVAGGSSSFFSSVAAIAPFLVAPAAGVALIAFKRLRQIAAALLAWTLFIVTQIPILLLFANVKDLLTVTTEGNLLGLGIAIQLAGAVVFLWILGLESIVRPGLILILIAATGALLNVLGKQWHYVSLIMVGVPGVVLGWYPVWLLFRLWNRVRARHPIPNDVLHLCLGWTVLTIFGVALTLSRRNALLATAAGLACCTTLIWVLLRRWRLRKEIPGQRLVLLRVFGSPHRAVSLLELLRNAWLPFGAVDLIVGTDLAAMTVGPVMLEAYLRRRVEDVYLKSPEDVDKRLASLDRRLQLDGRYPINELYCYANAWQDAVAKLVPKSDVVLMDLRGFSQSHAGCIFELNQILNLMPIERIVLLVDPSTCAEALQETLERAWRNLRPEAPSASSQDPVISLLTMPKFNATGRDFLASCLVAIAHEDRTPVSAIGQA